MDIKIEIDVGRTIECVSQNIIEITIEIYSHTAMENERRKFSNLHTRSQLAISIADTNVHFDGIIFAVYFADCDGKHFVNYLADFDES